MKNKFFLFSILILSSTFNLSCQENFGPQILKKVLYEGWTIYGSEESDSIDIITFYKSLFVTDEGGVICTDGADFQEEFWHVKYKDFVYLHPGFRVDTYIIPVDTSYSTNKVLNIRINKIDDEPGPIKIGLVCNIDKSILENLKEPELISINNLPLLEDSFWKIESLSLDGEIWLNSLFKDYLHKFKYTDECLSEFEISFSEDNSFEMKFKDNHLTCGVSIDKDKTGPFFFEFEKITHYLSFKNGVWLVRDNCLFLYNSNFELPLMYKINQLKENKMVLESRDGILIHLVRE